VFCPIRNVFDTVLQFNGLAGLPSYLQRRCYIRKHLGKHSSKLTKLKMQIVLRLSINAHRKQSFFLFNWLQTIGLTCSPIYRKRIVHFQPRSIISWLW